MREIVHEFDDGIFIGPLTRSQYRVILDGLELAASWTARDSSAVMAQALRNLIPRPEDIEEEGDFSSSPEYLRKIFPESPDE